LAKGTAIVRGIWILTAMTMAAPAVAQDNQRRRDDIATPAPYLTGLPRPRAGGSSAGSALLGGAVLASTIGLRRSQPNRYLTEAHREVDRSYSDLPRPEANRLPLTAPRPAGPDLQSPPTLPIVVRPPATVPFVLKLPATMP